MTLAGNLELFDLVAKGIHSLILEEVVLSPLGIVKGVTIQKHDETFHFNASNLFREDGEALAF